MENCRGLPQGDGSGADLADRRGGGLILRNPDSGSDRQLYRSGDRQTGSDRSGSFCSVPGIPPSACPLHFAGADLQTACYQRPGQAAGRGAGICRGGGDRGTSGIFFEELGTICSHTGAVMPACSSGPETVDSGFAAPFS